MKTNPGTWASSPGAVAPVAVDQLFIAGFVPGLSLVVLVSLYGMIQGYRSGAPRQPLRWKEAREAVWAAKWDLVVPVVVMGSFLSGVATIVESAAIGAAYALIVELTVFRNIHPWRDLPGALLNASALVGAVVVLLGVALGLTNYLVEAEIPTKLVEWVQAHIHSRWVFLLVLNIGLLVLGSVLDDRRADDRPDQEAAHAGRRPAELHQSGSAGEDGLDLRPAFRRAHCGQPDRWGSTTSPLSPR